MVGPKLLSHLVQRIEQQPCHDPGHGITRKRLGTLFSTQMPTNTHSERHRPLSGPKSNRGSRSTRTERLGQIKTQIVHWHMICLCKLQYLNYKMLNTEQLIELRYPNKDDVGNGTWWHCSWFAYLALFSKDLETTWPSELIRQWLQYL